MVRVTNEGLVRRGVLAHSLYLVLPEGPVRVLEFQVPKTEHGIFAFGLNSFCHSSLTLWAREMCVSAGAAD